MIKGENVSPVAGCGRLKTFAADGSILSWGPCAWKVPRYRYYKCGCDMQVCNPISEVLSGRVTPELRHLQVSLGAQTSYRKAADLLRMLLPLVGGTTHTTTRGIAVGERIDEEIRQEITEDRKPDKPGSAKANKRSGGNFPGVRRPRRRRHERSAQQSRGW